jgi:hypothetical protein
MGRGRASSGERTLAQASVRELRTRYLPVVLPSISLDSRPGYGNTNEAMRLRPGQPTEM